MPKASRKESVKEDEKKPPRKTAKKAAAVADDGADSEEAEKKPARKTAKKVASDGADGAEEKKPAKKRKAPAAEAKPAEVVIKKARTGGYAADSPIGRLGAMDHADCGSSFERMADFLLNHTVLNVNGRPYRFSEIEFYYCAPEHPDTFAHCDDLQLTAGQWYFHKKGKSYKAGSYKGLDLTFGSADAGVSRYGGVLIRAIEPLDNASELVQGSCRVADHILERCGVKSIPELVEGALGGTEADGTASDHHSLLFLTAGGAGQVAPRPVVRSARIGLTLKQADKDPGLLHYIARKYRFLTVPNLVDKKHYTTVALYEAGRSAAEISAVTGQTAKNVAAHVDAYEKGRAKALEAFIGEAMSVSDICEMFGAAAAFAARIEPRS